MKISLDNSRTYLTAAEAAQQLTPTGIDVCAAVNHAVSTAAHAKVDSSRYETPAEYKEALISALLELAPHDIIMDTAHRRIINKYGLPMVGLKAAATATRELDLRHGDYIRIMYRLHDGVITTVGQFYDDRCIPAGIIDVLHAYSPKTMQEIATAIDAAVRNDYYSALFQGGNVNKVSLDNGNTYMTAHEAMQEIKERNLWEQVVELMNDDTREQVNAELAPCTEEEFLTRYLELAPTDLIIG